VVGDEDMQATVAASLHVVAGTLLHIAEASVGEVLPVAAAVFSGLTTGPGESLSLVWV
jgi:hypothetical protein